jgi:hypothetical protein
MAIQTNIYDNKIYFALSYSNTIEEIIEPMNWDKMSNHIPRDKNWFGFTSDFIEDKYGLLFTFIIQKNGITGGGQTLKDIYEENGADFPIYFEFGYKVSNTRVQIKKWRINLQDYECDFGGVSCTIEKMPFQSKLRARFSSICNINTYSNMDGEVLTKIPTWTTRLHSKTLLLTTQAVSSSVKRSDEYDGSSGHPNTLNIQPDLTNITINEITDVFSTPMALMNVGSNVPATPSQIDPFSDFICQYTATTGGFLNLEIDCSFDFWLWHNNRQLASAGIEPSWNLTPRLRVQRFNGSWYYPTDLNGTTINITSSSSGYTFGTPPTDVLPSVTGGDRSNCNKVPVSWVYNLENIQIELGDNVYIFMVCTPSGSIIDSSPLVIQLDNFLTNNFKLTQLSTTEQTNANGFKIIDVLSQLLENITGQKDCVESSFFSEGGFGYNYLLLNGYGIRNFGGIAYNFKKDAQSLLNDLQSIFCVGIGIKEQYDSLGNPYEKIVIEYVSDFFKTRVIGTYEETYEWKDKNRSNDCYNIIQLGYNKYLGLNINQNDEFCTEGEYLLQNVLINNNTLNKKSSLIASGYLIENQRRNQFLSNPQQTLTFDEDIFIIATCNNIVLNNVTCLFSNVVFDTITCDSDLCLKTGDTFTVDSGANSGTVFTIVSQVVGYPVINLSGDYIDSYYISPSPVLSSYSTNITILPSSPDQIFAERNNPFEICSNVISPNTIYNGRLALKNILYNWRPIIGVGTYFIDPTSTDYRVNQIVTNRVYMNSLFSHKFLSTEINKGNVGDKQLVENTNEVINNYLYEGTNIYSPVGSQCKIKIGWNEMDVIRKALCGELNDDTKDYGGIVCKDDFSEFWFCHIIDIQYNLVNQIATLQLQKVFKTSL